MGNPSKSEHWSTEPLLNEAMADAGLYKAIRAQIDQTAEGTTNAVAIKAYNSMLAVYEMLRTDGLTKALQTIDYVHHEIHAGSHFFYADHNSVDSGASVDFLITTPNTAKEAHIIFIVDGTAITQFYLYEGSDKNGVAAQTVFNSDRNSLTANTTTVHKGLAGGTTDGTLLWTNRSGYAAGATRIGAESRNDEEIILKQNTKYILRAASGTNGNLINIKMDFYEHTRP